ncbi:hypothetical protein GCM10025881_37380 [Pseudolysinimonas kribbensis]|uniref:Uncharacterized protein n=1 Tax=Pseudolysinimonas kribbensis TaxID=433641 RepID=A0ABQ6K926_9MICO|nr:hypothetical protein GCM10025881_37380 [Pseudolysinimonas kribbensis]
MCGVGTLRVKPSDAVKAWGSPVRVVPGELGGQPRPEPVFGYVCPTDRRVVAEVGAVGHPAVERAILAHLGWSLNGRTYVEPLGQAWVALRGAEPNALPWQHLRRGRIEARLARTVGAHKPGKVLGGRVDLTEVEAAVLRLCREYGVARLRFDRMQAEQMVGNLTREGVRVREFVFSAAGASKLARGLFVALRDRAVELPDDDELRSEAQTVRMIETGPGLVKMSNPAGTHDDVLTAVGMVVADLTEQPDLSGGGVSDPSRVSIAARARASGVGPVGQRLLSPAYALGGSRGTLAAIAQAQRGQTPAQRAHGIGLPVEGTANDPNRR